MKLILIVLALIASGCSDQRYACVDGKVMVWNHGIWIESYTHSSLTCTEGKQ